MTHMVIAEGTDVTLHFSLALEDGTIIDSNFDAEPAHFSVGDGSLLPGFETVLIGLTAGHKKAFELGPEAGFGQANPNNIQRMPRKEFAPDMALEQGLVISFADANKAELPGVVASFNDDFVNVDFNHPLAGRSIHFDVEILDVKISS
jgi:FKBP-type peptidyl-prolyl cis-trans isomerase SlpA